VISLFRLWLFHLTAGKWGPIDSGLSYKYVSALAINPQSPSILYAGSGRGVFKLLSRPSWDSDDDGKSDISVWRPSNGVWYTLPSSGNLHGEVLGSDDRCGDFASYWNLAISPLGPKATLSRLNFPFPTDPADFGYSVMHE
jgi:hypothetical protein